MPSTERVEACARCGHPMTKTSVALYMNPLQYLWRCDDCCGEVFLEEPGGLAVAPTDRPPPAPSVPCAHAGPQCACACHSNPCIIHDHACCSLCVACGFRTPCACEHCRRAPSSPSSR